MIDIARFLISTSPILQVKGDLSGIPVMLVGNKCDEETSKRQVAKKMGEALQVTTGAKFDIIFFGLIGQIFGVLTFYISIQLS